MSYLSASDIIFLTATTPANIKRITIMTYQIHQIIISDAAAAEVNRSEQAPQWYLEYLAINRAPTQELITKARRMYSHVANIIAEDLDEAFDIGNSLRKEASQLWIDRLGPMRSVSVGDVLIDKAGAAFVVTAFGFDSVQF